MYKCIIKCEGKDTVNIVNLVTQSTGIVSSAICQQLLETDC